MHLRKILLIGIIIFLSGCSSFYGYSNINTMLPLPKIKTKFTPTQVWSKSIFRSISSSFYFHPAPTWKDNCIYAANYIGIVKAIDIKSGNIIWSVNLAEKYNFFSYKPAKLSGILAVSENMIFVGSEHGFIYGLNLKDGTEIWKTMVFSEVISRPVISDHLILIHTTNGMLQALRKKDGVIEWSVHLENMPLLTLRGESPPVISYGAAIVGTDNGFINAVLLQNGQIIWRQSVTQLKGATEIERIKDVDTTPVVVDNVVYSLGYNGNLAALDLRSGQVKWKYLISSVNDFIVEKKHIYIVDQNDQIFALSINGGLSLWQQSNLLHRNLTAPVLYHDYLIVGDCAGYVHWIDIKNGLFVSQQKVDSSGLLSISVVNSDELIIQARSGKFYAFVC
ncbi:outer membrane protein assembly factor BamB [Candidatus Profftia sp. (ex Adelges kitamiensis)]|uniref:outer membrane protein assembly factor BamB n=1 Tax=Candidatus Profftia sp. (ex Adelges kitamiensis) TaxID=2864218 RepID=UPI001CE26074|nr:outer membrane protein assembly factor BamB [Candidatus Profftia sp. (ex Adelges kitamiensis)]